MIERIWMVGALCVAGLAGCGEAGEGLAVARETSVAGRASGGGAADPVCQVVAPALPLPVEVRETSGLAQSRRDPARFWTHNDAGNGPELFAVDAGGTLVQRVRVTGARAADWEDIEAGPCPAGNCLYVGDIGDNDGRREGITIYRIPEPEPGRAESQPAAALQARFPDGPQDAESLFALGAGELYLVTKGRGGPIALYRYPAPQRPGETVTLERVRELFPEPRDADDRVTGATASPDGRWVAIRSYRRLYLYPAAALLDRGSTPPEPIVVDLAPLGHSQGEAVAMAADGAVWLSTEANKGDDGPAWARLQCTLPEG